MSDPLRFSKGGAGELEKLLVASVRGEAPAPQSRQRVHAVLGLGAGVGAASKTTAALGAAKVLAPAGGVLSLAQWGGVAVVALAAVGAGVYLPMRAHSEAQSRAAHGVPSILHSTSVPSAPNAASPTPSPAAPPTPSAAPPLPTAPVPPVGGPSPRGAAPVAPVSVPLTPPMSGAAAPIAGRPNVAPNGTAGASLGDELRALDDARTALTSGNTARALALLDRHDHDFVPAALAPEAMALRIEAYAGSGRRDSVARLASRFLSLYGDRPEAQRVRSILQAQQVDPNP